MTNIVIVFIHLSAAGIALGSLIYGLLLLLPAIKKIEADNDLPAEETAEYKLMEILMPTVFVCLLTLVGSGIYFLMENYADQVNLKPGYYNLFGVKMIFVLGAFFASLYTTFFLRTSIANLDITPENRERVPEVLKKMQGYSTFCLTLIVFAVFFGIWLARF
ncbi:MAG: hypothetical protein G3M78_03195 [Candidatus Nitrohelix vancouverensis]|uniref:Copper resistance protein D domain-containing protein n=1 Tax=Candidatus Nitrohelix vancouverensis TaxID=2705534 RepID=A0A7T0C0T4_9BACT|nr:MAG: hypothetical protein G3M78_03195 [Candidatus Nitrohelix vancouverensis]